MIRKKDHIVPEGFGQYHAPSNTELSGRTFLLRYDDGRHTVLHFLSDRIVLTGRPGDSPRLEECYCQKATELAYLVHVHGTEKPHHGMTFVLDLEQRLTTRLDVTKKDPDYPHWFVSSATFGYIDLPGYPAPTERHGYTGMLAGNRIQWRYDEAILINHIYVTDKIVRLGWIGTPPPGPTLFEEPMFHVKIKSNVVLMCFVECNIARENPDMGGCGILLMDTDKMTDVGIFYEFDEKGKEIYRPVAACGKLIYEAFPQESLPSPHDQFFGTDGERIR